MKTVHLDTNLESRLRQAVKVSGKSESLIVHEAIERLCDEILGEETLDIVLADYVGCVASDGNSDARSSKEVLGEVLAEKRKRGHL